MLSQPSTRVKAIGSLRCNSTNGRTCGMKACVVQVAVTQDDDSEMTGFCPEAKAWLHAPFSCEMLVQAKTNGSRALSVVQIELIKLPVHPGSSRLDPPILSLCTPTMQLRPPPHSANIRSVNPAL